MLSPSYEKEGKKLDKKNAEKTDEFGTREPTAAEGLINSWLSYDKQNIKNYINDPYIGVSPSATIFYMAPILAIAGKAIWSRVPVMRLRKESILSKSVLRAVFEIVGFMKVSSFLKQIRFLPSYFKRNEDPFPNTGAVFVLVKRNRTEQCSVRSYLFRTVVVDGDDCAWGRVFGDDLAGDETFSHITLFAME